MNNQPKHQKQLISTKVQQKTTKNLQKYGSSFKNIDIQKLPQQYIILYPTITTKHPSPPLPISIAIATHT